MYLEEDNQSSHIEEFSKLRVSLVIGDPYKGLSAVMYVIHIRARVLVSRLSI